MTALLETVFKTWLQEKHGFETLSDEDQVTWLAYFVARGRPLTSYPTTVDEDLQAWEECWLDHAADAGLTSKVGSKGFVRWLKLAVHQCVCT